VTAGSTSAKGGRCRVDSEAPAPPGGHRGAREQRVLGREPRRRADPLADHEHARHPQHSGQTQHHRRHRRQGVPADHQPPEPPGNDQPTAPDTNRDPSAASPAPVTTPASATEAPSEAGRYPVTDRAPSRTVFPEERTPTTASRSWTRIYPLLPLVERRRRCPGRMRPGRRKALCGFLLRTVHRNPGGQPTDNRNRSSWGDRVLGWVTGGRHFGRGARCRGYSTGW